MRKTVGILDDVVEYGQRLANTINTRKVPGLRATFILNPFEVKEKIADHQIQILLVSEKYACELEDASIPMYLLVSDPVHGDTPGPGEREVPRYSQLTDILEILLSEVKEKKKKKDERLIVVFSPDSIDEALKLGQKLAEDEGKNGKTLFLPFDNFYGNHGKKSLTELLYRGLGSKEQLTELLEMAAGEGFDAFDGPEHFSDLWQYTEEQMKSLLSALEEAGYQHIVITAGFMSDAVFCLFNLCDTIYFPNMNSFRSNEVMRQLNASGASEIAEKVREYL